MNVQYYFPDADEMHQHNSLDTEVDNLSFIQPEIKEICKNVKEYQSSKTILILENILISHKHTFLLNCDDFIYNK